MDPRGTGAPIGPRVVVVTRPSELELLIAHHGTKEQARFVLRQRGQELGPVEAAHRALEDAARTVLGALPLSYRRARVGRQDLPRFLFEPADVIVAVGQDGLVANVAKYLEEQPVIAVCPSTPGVLARTSAAAFADQLADVLAARARIEERTMVEARLDDGQVLRSLNEIFVGHRSHQSARYELWSPDAARHEHQSSSGVVFASGTGATGWAASIARQSRDAPALPRPTDPHLVYLVREAWPSPSTGTSLVAGAVQAAEKVALVSAMNEGGVVFGDGMETDRLTLGWGQRVEVGPSARRLRLAA